MVDQFALPSLDHFLPRASISDAMLRGLAPKPPVVEPELPPLTPEQAAQRDLILNPRGALGEVVAGGMRGVTYELPRMIGQMFKSTGKKGDVGYGIGQGIQDFTKSMNTRFLEDRNPDAHNVVTQAFASGASMLAPSLAPLAALPVAGALGLGAGASLAVAGAAGAGLFGASAYEDTYQKAIDAGKPEAEAKAAALKVATIEAGGEAIATPVLGRLLGAGSRVLSGAKKMDVPAAIDAIQKPQFWSRFGAEMGKTSAVEVGTEMGQNYGEALVEKNAGISTEDPYHAATSAIGPTLAMTAFLGPFAALGMRRQIRTNQDALRMAQQPDHNQPVATQLSSVHSGSTYVAEQIKPMVGAARANEWRLEQLENANRGIANAEMAGQEADLPEMLAARQQRDTEEAAAAQAAADIQARQQLGGVLYGGDPRSIFGTAAKRIGARNVVLDTLDARQVADDAALAQEDQQALVREQTQEEQAREWLRALVAEDSARLEGQKQQQDVHQEKVADLKGKQQHWKEYRATGERLAQEAAQTVAQRNAAVAKAAELPGQTLMQQRMQEALARAATPARVSVAPNMLAAAAEQGISTKGQVARKIQEFAETLDALPEKEILPAAQALRNSLFKKGREPSMTFTAVDAYVKTLEKQNANQTQNEPQNVSQDATQDVTPTTGVSEGQDQGAPSSANQEWREKGEIVRRPAVPEADQRPISKEMAAKNTRTRVEKGRYDFENYAYERGIGPGEGSNQIWLDSLRAAQKDAALPDNQRNAYRKRNAEAALQWANDYHALDVTDAEGNHYVLSGVRTRTRENRIAQAKNSRAISDQLARDRARDIMDEYKGNKALTEQEAEDRAIEELKKEGVDVRKLRANEQAKDAVKAKREALRPAEDVLKAHVAALHTSDFDYSPKVTKQDKAKIKKLFGDPKYKGVFNLEAYTGDYNPELAAVVGGGSVQKVLEYLMNNASTLGIRSLARYLHALELGTTIDFVDRYSFTGISWKGPVVRLGGYDHTNNAVRMFKGGMNEHSVLHELVHAATAGRLLRAQALEKTGVWPRGVEEQAMMADLNAIRSLMKDLRSRPGANAYGMTDPLEFVAETLSNEEFRAWLDTGQQGGKTYLQRFWDWLLGALGVRRGTDLEMESALKQATDLSYQMATGDWFDPGHIKLDQQRGFDVKRSAGTEPFAAWFKGSKVVDKQGNPLVVYHGTYRDTPIDKFELRGRDAAFYFTTDPAYAAKYSNGITHRPKNQFDQTRDLTGMQPAVYPVYISMQNPYYTGKGSESHNITKERVSELKSQGYDGIIYSVLLLPPRPVSHAEAASRATEIVVFDSAQVKSATGNSGAFDENNPNIMESQAVFAPANAFLPQFMHQVDRAMQSYQSLGNLPSNIRSVFVSLSSAHQLGKMFEKSQYAPMRKFGEALKQIERVDGQQQAVLQRNRSEAYAIARSLEEALLGLPDKRARQAMSATLARVGGEMSRLNVDLNKDFAGNLAAGAEIENTPAMKSHVNSLHADYKRLPVQFRAPLNQTFALNRKLYIQQTATTLSNYLRMKTKEAATVAPWLQMLDIEDATLSANTTPIKQAPGVLPYYLDRYTEALDKRIEAVLTALHANKAVNDEYVQGVEKFYRAAVKNPYQHLGRTGNFYVEFDIADNAQALAAVQSIVNPYGKLIGEPARGNRHVFLRFENSAQAEALHTQLKGLGAVVVPNTLAGGSLLNKGVVENSRGIAPFAQKMIAEMQAQLDAGAGTRTADEQKMMEELVQHARQVALDMHPDDSARKALTRRKEGGVLGYEGDFLRNYDARALNATAMLASSYVSPKYAEVFSELRRQVENMATMQDVGPTIQPQAQAALASARQRYANSLNPIETPIVDGAKAFGHAFYLGLSPAYYLTNAMQPWHLTLPVLGGRYGFVKTAKEMSKSTGKALRVIHDTLATGAGEGNRLGGVAGAIYGVLDATVVLENAGLRADEAAFVQHLIKLGTMNETQGHEQGRLAEGGDPRLAAAAKFVSAGAHYGEVVNRITAGLTAYNLETQAGGSTEQATQRGVAAVRDTQYAYSDRSTAPTLGRHGFAGKVTPLFTQFMSYSFQTMELLFRMLRDAKAKMPAGLSSEQQAEWQADRVAATKGLVGVLGTTSLLAGTLGLPFASVIARVMDAFGDDDDPSDVKSAYRRWLASVFGKDVAEAIAHGLPQAVAGVATTGRMGLQDLLPGSRFITDRRQLQDRIKDGTLNALGPGAGAGVDLVVGMSHMADGRILDGLTEMLPLALRNPAKALKMTTEGYTNATGNQIPIPVTAMAVATQALGFTPGVKAEQSEVNFAFKTRDVLLKQERGRLANQIYIAVERKGGITPEQYEKLHDWNTKNPEYSIDLKQALQARARARGVAEVSGTDVPTLARYLPILERYTYANTR